MAREGSPTGRRIEEILFFSTRKGHWCWPAKLVAVERADAEAIYDAGRERCVELVLELAGRCEELAGRCERLEELVKADRPPFCRSSRYESRAVTSAGGSARLAA